jgi:hypothetical protein
MVVASTSADVLMVAEVATMKPAMNTLNLRQR